MAPGGWALLGALGLTICPGAALAPAEVRRCLSVEGSEGSVNGLYTFHPRLQQDGQWRPTWKKEEKEGGEATWLFHSKWIWAFKQMTHQGSRLLLTSGRTSAGHPAKVETGWIPKGAPGAKADVKVAAIACPAPQGFAVPAMLVTLAAAAGGALWLWQQGRWDWGIGGEVALPEPVATPPRPVAEVQAPAAAGSALPAPAAAPPQLWAHTQVPAAAEAEAEAGDPARADGSLPGAQEAQGYEAEEARYPGADPPEAAEAGGPGGKEEEQEDEEEGEVEREEPEEERGGEEEAEQEEGGAADGEEPEAEAESQVVREASGRPPPAPTRGEPEAPPARRRREVAGARTPRGGTPRRQGVAGQARLTPPKPAGRQQGASRGRSGRPAPWSAELGRCEGSGAAEAAAGGMPLKRRRSLTPQAASEAAVVSHATAAEEEEDKRSAQVVMVRLAPPTERADRSLSSEGSMRPRSREAQGEDRRGRLGSAVVKCSGVAAKLADRVLPGSGLLFQALGRICNSDLKEKELVPHIRFARRAMKMMSRLQEAGTDQETMRELEECLNRILVILEPYFAENREGKLLREKLWDKVCAPAALEEVCNEEANFSRTITLHQLDLTTDIWTIIIQATAQTDAAAAPPLALPSSASATSSPFAIEDELELPPSPAAAAASRAAHLQAAVAVAVAAAAPSPPPSPISSAACAAAPEPTDEAQLAPCWGSPDVPDEEFSPWRAMYRP